MTSQSNADVTVTFKQDGNDVTGTWSGSLSHGPLILGVAERSLVSADATSLLSISSMYNGAPSVGVASVTDLNAAPSFSSGSIDSYGFAISGFVSSFGGSGIDFGGSNTIMTWTETDLATIGADNFDNFVAWTANTSGDRILYKTFGFVANAIDHASLSTSATVFSSTPLIASTTMNGSHHRILMDSGLDEDGWHSWITGDFARFDETDSDQTLGEVGASRGFFNDTLRFGMGVGFTTLNQDTIFSGGSKIDGEFGLAEVNYRLPHNVILSSLLYYGQFDAETSRGYAGGGAKSRGETDIESLALRLRVDWKDAYKSDKFSITPRLAYTLIDSSADAYTETGGATPATYAKQDAQDHEVRLGFDIDYALSEKTQLRTILEAVHRENDNNNLTGTSGGIGFNIDAQTSNNTWGRLGFDVIHALNEKTNLTAAIFTSTEGYDPTFSGSIGLNMSF